MVMKIKHNIKMHTCVLTLSILELHNRNTWNGEKCGHCRKYRNIFLRWNFAFLFYKNFILINSINATMILRNHRVIICIFQSGTF